MELYLIYGNLGDVMEDFNKKFSSGKFSVIERKIEFKNNICYVSVIYIESKENKKVFPDSRKCINLDVKQDSNFPEIIYERCLPCAGKLCREMYGSEACFHFYKEK